MKKNQNRVTIKDIALKCNVTANTVSRALRDDRKISEATIQKIKKTAQEMGYVRNNMASAMRSGSSHLISIIVDDLPNPHYSTLIDKIDSLLKKNGYDIMILCSHGKIEESLKMANLSISNLVNGIIYFPDSNDRNVSERIKKNHIPLVLVDRAVSGIETDVVRVDDYQGGVLAAECMYMAGHRKFLYICGPEGNGAQPLRQQGFLDTLSEYGIGPSEIRIIRGDQIYPMRDSAELFKLLQPIRYTGIFSFNDQIAYYVMNALLAYGYRVPDDISMIGFDHIRCGMPYLRPLSSVGCENAGELAERIVELLLRRIDNPEYEFVSEILPVMLYEAESTVKKI
ncbi:MAG TPA: LacI family transcriptional regulator [Candidatus Eisenbergiella stercoravium]|nr:LacI family transcriptional regulator [Candidatus Eisenbergiella stercoravium]